MSIPATCPSCGHTGSATDKALGKRLKCPMCGSKFRLEVFTDASKKPFDTAYDKDRWWRPRVKALEKILGPQGDTDLHAPTLFDMGAELGGAPDVHTFNRHKKRVVVSYTSEIFFRDIQHNNNKNNNSK